MLEERVAVLVRAAHGGALGVQAVVAEGSHCVHVTHFLQVIVVPDGDLLDLMGRAEAVEEVDERDAALDGGQVRDRGKVHDFLRVGLAEHGEAGLTAGVDVGMIAEDVQRMGRDGTRGDMEDGGQQFTGDLIHVRDHQQKPLRSSIGRRQSAGGQRAVNGAGSACLGLHLDDLDAVAEDVLTALRRPLVDIVGHRAGGGDGVDAGYFRKGVADMGGGGVCINV